MVKVAPAVSFAILGLTLVACNEHGPSATAPSGPGGLTIDGRDAILTGQSFRYGAISSGTGASTPATWTSSDTTVATVDANGLVRALKQGSTRLDASFQGLRASRLVDVVDNVAGVWNGSATIRRCEEAGRFFHEWWPTCRGVVAWTFPVVLQLSQNSDDARRITGIYDLSYLMAMAYGHCDVYGPAIRVTGQTSNDGHLSLSGATASLDESQQWIVGGWDTYLTAPDEMHGRWAQDLIIASGKSYWEVEVNLKATQVGPCGVRYRGPL